MDHDGDFSAYVSARWAALTRSAIVLGCPPDEAADLVQTTLLRCYTGWNRVQRAANRDAYIYRILLNCFRDSRRRRWWKERPSAVVPDQAVPDRTDLVDLADLLGVPIGTVKSRLSRAMAQLATDTHLSRLSEGEN